MTYKAKYFNLNYVPEGWSREDFVWIVEKLETMPKEKLLSLCDLPQIQLQFLDIRKLDQNKTAKGMSTEYFDQVMKENPDSWKEIEDEDQIIRALVGDYTPDILISAIKEVIGE